MSPEGRLGGKACVILGAGGTLGPELVARFAAAGVAGVAIGDLDRGSLAAAEAAAGREAPVFSQVTDVTDPEQVDSLIGRAMAEFGGLDVLVNNAGVLARSARLHNTTAEDWQRSFAVNLMGTVNGMKGALAAMRPAGKGAIVNTASVAGMTTWPYAGPYGVLKAAVIQATKVAAVEYADDGIRVNCVCPGVFPSAMHEGLPEEAMRDLDDRHPLGMGTPGDVADAYVYLASEEARWVTGTALVVDGGYAVNR